MHQTNYPLFMELSLSKRPDIPREASLDRLERILIKVENAALKKKTIIDELGVNDDAGYDTIRLGTSLGFLNDTDRGVTITPLGEELLASSLPESVYREGLANHTDYCTILSALSHKDLLHTGPLERATVIQILQNDLGIDMSDNTLSERVNTFFRTCEAAGLGEFISGKPNTVAHFKLTHEFNSLLPNILKDTATQDSGDEPQVQPTTAFNIQTTLPEASSKAEPEHDDPAHPQFQLSFQVSSSMDPEQIEEAVVAIRRGLRRDLEPTDAS